MKVVFVAPSANAPERVVVNAEIHFEDVPASPLRGCKLTGFTVWKGVKNADALYVTLPSRPNRGRGFYNLVQSIEDGALDPTNRLQAFILEQYEIAQKGNALPKAA